ncbi:hypothetical protein [Cellulomonas marina]|uniref:Uncharacterized protein n=1 Tax=Cellulomonas marina TaxID=988821 RepID=A0A1I0ZF49_9CELL|nr:hypothetical protein [Cellulomonas marina]SFB24245.1 hypothetical protein SAMN05421867_1113 [Cellulomonas marina]
MDETERAADHGAKLLCDEARRVYDGLRLESASFRRTARLLAVFATVQAGLAHVVAGASIAAAIAAASALLGALAGFSRVPDGAPIPPEWRTALAQRERAVRGNRRLLIATACCLVGSTLLMAGQQFAYFMI